LHGDFLESTIFSLPAPVTLVISGGDEPWAGEQLWTAKIQGPARFLNTSMAEALAEFEGGGEVLAGKFPLAESQVGDAAKVEAIRPSPGIFTVRLF